MFSHNQKIKIIIWIIIIILFFYCKTEQVKLELNGHQLTWSSYQGQMRWDPARTKCAVLGMNLPTSEMRLPTREEGVAAAKKGLIKTWGRIKNF